MDHLWKDLRHAVRSLAKSSGFTAVALLTLALGIGATTSVFSVVHGVLLRPLPYPQADRLALLFTVFDNGSTGDTTGPDFSGWRVQSRSFEDLAAYTPTSRVYLGKGEPERLPTAMLTVNLLPLLGAQPQLGRVFAANEGRMGAHQVVLLSDRFWRTRLGGDSAAVGQALLLGQTHYTVVGVLPPQFDFPDSRTELWIPLPEDHPAMQEAGEHFLTVAGRMKPGVRAEDAQEELAIVAARVRESLGRGDRKLGVAVAPLQAHLVRGVREPLLLMMGAVALVFLIAVMNVAHLLLSRALNRRRETTMRAALGAGRWRLFSHSVAESLVLSLLGGAGGLLLAEWAVQGMLAMGADIPRKAEVGLDAWVVLFALGLSLGAGMLAGIIPAFRALRFNLGDSLRASAATASPHGRGQGNLVALEVALSVVLLTGAGLLIHSFVRLASVDSGFDTNRLLAMRLSLPASRYPENAQQFAFVRQSLEKLGALPGVVSAGLVSHLPLEADYWRYGTVVEGRPVETKMPIAYRLVSPAYFQAMGMPILEGRALTEEDREDRPRVLVINRTAANLLFPGESPVGRRLDFSYCRAVPCEIVGVVGDVRHLGLDQKEDAAMYGSFWQKPEPGMNEFALVVRTAGDPAGAVAAAKQQVWSLDQQLPFQRVATMEEVLSATLAPRRFTSSLMGLFAIVAAALAVVGIQGMVACAVAQHTREIGVRMALGAQPADVLRWMTGKGMKPVLAGLLLGLAGALGLSRFLQSHLFDLSPTDPATLAAVCLLLATAALVACWIPARRAARVDPVIALRHE